MYLQAYRDISIPCIHLVFQLRIWDLDPSSFSASMQVRVGGYRLPKELGIGQFQELKPHEVRRVIDTGAQSNPYL